MRLKLSEKCRVSAPQLENGRIAYAEFNGAAMCSRSKRPLDAKTVPTAGPYGSRQELFIMIVRA